jgi:arginine decarboxylase
VLQQLRPGQSDVTLSEDGRVLWYGIDLNEVARTHGTPLKLTYVPRVRDNVAACQRMFADALARHGYGGKYQYCYCTKTNHYQFVLEEVLACGAGLEFSSRADLDILRLLQARGLVRPGRTFEEAPMLCNGHKDAGYVSAIVAARASGFHNLLPILDSVEELDELLDNPAVLLPSSPVLQIGVRFQSSKGGPTQSSRFGIGRADAVALIRDEIEPLNGVVQVKMLHYMANTGVVDTEGYWEVLGELMDTYVELKRLHPSLDCLNLGGGMPHSSAFEGASPKKGKSSPANRHDPAVQADVIDRTVAFIKQRAQAGGVAEPHLFTEFGSFTVANTAVNVFSVKAQKQQRKTAAVADDEEVQTVAATMEPAAASAAAVTTEAERQTWYQIDSSFVTTMPDSWAKKMAFACLPLNHMHREFKDVTLGGMTCDSDDFYCSEQHGRPVRLPAMPAPERQQRRRRHAHALALAQERAGVTSAAAPVVEAEAEVVEEDLRVAFFDTGAYQDNLAGYGGLKHCMLGSPKHLLARSVEAPAFLAEGTASDPNWWVAETADQQLMQHGVPTKKMVHIETFSQQQSFESLAELLGHNTVRDVNVDRETELLTMLTTRGETKHTAAATSAARLVASQKQHRQRFAAVRNRKVGSFYSTKAH